MILKTSFCLRLSAYLITTLEPFFLLIWIWFQLYRVIKRIHVFREQRLQNLQKIISKTEHAVCIWILWHEIQVWRFLTGAFSRIVVLRVQERTSLHTSSEIVSIDSGRSVSFETFENESCLDSSWFSILNVCFLQAVWFCTEILWCRGQESQICRWFFSYYRKFMSQIRFISKKQFRVAWMSAAALCALSKSFQKSLTWSSDSFGYLKPW